MMLILQTLANLMRHEEYKKHLIRISYYRWLIIPFLMYQIPTLLFRMNSIPSLFVVNIVTIQSQSGLTPSFVGVCRKGQRAKGEEARRSCSCLLPFEQREERIL